MGGDTITVRNDSIMKYVTTVHAGESCYCPHCDQKRPLWRGETAGGELLTCCCFCQRIHKREPIHGR